MRARITAEGRRLLTKALARIKAMPTTFNMGTWIEHDELAEPDKKIPAPYCGTVACLAGHIVLAAGFTQEEGFYRLNEIPSRWRGTVRKWAVKTMQIPEHQIEDRYFDPGDIAAAIMGIGRDEDGGAPGGFLWYTDQWPTRFARAYHKAEGREDQRRMSRVAIERVKHFLRTGK